MSAGVCGKRFGFEEFIGSPPSSKRSRCSRYGSPVRAADLGLGSDDKGSVLLRMFPYMDREVVERVLRTHDNKIDDAIKSLHALCLGDGPASNGVVILDSMAYPNDNNFQGASDAQTSGTKIEVVENNSLESSLPGDKSSWADVLVQEMMKASDVDDACGRVMKILRAFQTSVLAESTPSDDAFLVQQQVLASLKEQLLSLMRENQILKRAVSIQHERSLEYDEKPKEVEQLKHIISQYQEQVRTLELHNYTLKIHLQRAHDANSIPNRYHPDIF